MTKFEKVSKLLEEKTYGSNNYITLTKNLDARHNGKYAIKNVITNNIDGTSYKTLDEVIETFELDKVTINDNKKIDMWIDSELTWRTYTIEELKNKFTFVTEPKWEKIDDIYFHDNNNKWLNINFEHGNEVYKNVFGTYSRG